MVIEKYEFKGEIINPWQAAQKKLNKELKVVVNSIAIQTIKGVLEKCTPKNEETIIVICESGKIHYWPSENFDYEIFNSSANLGITKCTKKPI
jgi:hypothetical protein